MSNEVTRILLDRVVDDAYANHDARASLRAENAKLREALQEMVRKLESEGMCHYPLLQKQYEQARAALAEPRR